MAVKETARSAQAQMATLPERVAVVETKVDAMIVCIESIKDSQKDIRADVKDMHDCLDNTREMLADKLEKMQDEYRANSGKYFEHADKLHAEDQASHSALDKKIKDLESFKTKWVYMTAGAIAALGFVSGHATTLLALFK
jgi:tetrahydromethanopterin S-methyltransferase subunit B